MAYPNPADDDWLLSSFIDFDNFDPSSGNPWTSTDPSEPSNTAGVNTESNGRLESYLVPEAVASRQAKKRRPCRFTKKQREVMDQWITAATNEPYLTASSRKELADATGLAPKQVQQYFTNFRRRHRQKLGQIYDPPFVLQDRPLTTSWQTGFEGTIDRTCEEADKVSGHDVDSDGPGLSIEARPPSRRSCQSSSSADSALSYTDVCGSAAALHQANSAEAFATFNGTLLEFYLLTVHQNQAASPRDSAVPALLERNDRPTHLTSPSESPTKAVHALTDTNPSSPELIGPDEPLSASGSIFSGHSYQHSTDNSVASTSSVFSTGSRRGRRVFGSSNARAAVRPASRLGIPCSQCAKMFTRAYTLKRHVEAVHENKHRWICRPLPQTSTSRSLICPICRQDAMYCSHDMGKCWSKAQGERTFSRKDALKQHLKLVHGYRTQQVQYVSTIKDDVLDMLHEMEACDEDDSRSQVMEQHCLCSFCSRLFLTSHQDETYQSLVTIERSTTHELSSCVTSRSSWREGSKPCDFCGGRPPHYYIFDWAHRIDCLIDANEPKDFDSGKEFRKARAQDIFSRYCRFRGMLTMTTWREVLIEASCKIVNNYWLSYPHPEIVVDTGSEAVSMADRSTIISPADSFDCTTAMQALELPLFNAG